VGLLEGVAGAPSRCTESRTRRRIRSRKSLLMMNLWRLDSTIEYLRLQGRGVAERNSQRAQDARDDLRRIAGFSVADEKSISLISLRNQDRSRVEEFTRFRAKLVQ
jgi:hypothetical protein